MKYCPQCGNPAEDYSAACANCGSALLQSGPIPAGFSESVPPPPPVSAESAPPTEPTPPLPQETAPPIIPPVVPSPNEPPPVFTPPSAYDAPPPGNTYATPPPGNTYATPPSSYPQSGFAPQGFPPPGAEPFAESPAVSVFKKIASSGLFLAAVLAYTASLVLTFITAFLPGPNVLEILSELEDIGLPEEWVDMLWDSYYNSGGLNPGATGTNVASTVFGMIPSIIICVALWNIYTAGRSKTAFVRTGGMSVVRVMTIIAMVGICLFPLILLIAGVACLVLAGNLSGEESAAMMVVGIICFFCILFTVLPILYFAFLSSTIKSIRHSLITGDMSVKVSQFVLVVNFFGAASSLLSLISSSSLMSSVGLSGATMFVSTLSTICSVAFTVTMTIALVQYKTAMKNARLQQTMQMGSYPPPGFAPPPGFPPPPPPGFAPPPPPPQYTNPYDVYQPQPQADPYQTGPLPPPQQGDYIFCHVCSKQYASGVAFCPHCGTARIP